MSLTFITSRKEKFEEMQAILNPIELTPIYVALPEIQELDADLILKEKIRCGSEFVPRGQFIVDDTSVYFDCLGGILPGPFIKQFFQALKCQGLYELTRDLKNDRATAVTRIGYRDSGYSRFGGSVTEKIFTGEMEGRIVEPRGSTNLFDWNTIFQPNGCDKTFGEMNLEEKNTISMRFIAAQKLKNYLLNERPKIED